MHRYTPLLAFLLLPNMLFKSFGKLCFAATDILVAWLMLRHLSAKTTQALAHHDLKQPAVAQRLQIWTLAAWLFNPYTATISTRGNGDALVTLMQISLLMLMKGRARTYSTRPNYNDDKVPTVSEAETGGSTVDPAKTAGENANGLGACTYCVHDSPADADSSANARLNLAGVSADDWDKQNSLECVGSDDGVWTVSDTVDALLAGCLFGLLVHWRVFPLIYGPSLVLYIWEIAPTVCSFPVLPF